MTERVCCRSRLSGACQCELAIAVATSQHVSGFQTIGEIDLGDYGRALIDAAVPARQKPAAFGHLCKDLRQPGRRQA